LTSLYDENKLCKLQPKFTKSALNVSMIQNVIAFLLYAYVVPGGNVYGCTLGDYNVIGNCGFNSR